MKKILNEWKRFLLKEGAPNVPFDDEFLETEECVYHWDDDDEEHHIILYRKIKPGKIVKSRGDKPEQFYVIGYIAAMQITEPGDDLMQCIPNTFQVSAIYVEPELRGKDFGNKLYSLAFAALPMNAGLTSDKYSGTLSGAKRIWDKMANSPQFIKRKTDLGSDEFDYTTYETPDDPQDDCGTPYKKHDAKNASHHSFEKANKSAGIMLLNKYKENHEKNFFPSGQKDLTDDELKAITLSKTKFEERVFGAASARFGQIYSSLSN